MAIPEAARAAASSRGDGFFQDCGFDRKSWMASAPIAAASARGSSLLT
jgi:hypothetical protein